MGKFTIEEAVGDYMAIKDQRATLKAAFEEEDNKLKRIQEKIEAYLLQASNETGVDSFRTPYGTASRVTKRVFNVKDADAFIDWVIQTDNRQMLPKRANSAPMKEYFEEHESTPPGVEAVSFSEISITRPRAATTTKGTDK